MDEPIGSSSYIRIAHATHSPTCMETGARINRGDICVKLWGHSKKTRNGRSVRYLSLGGVDTLQARLNDDGPDAVNCMRPEVIPPERTPPLYSCGVCYDHPSPSRDEPVEIFQFGSKLRYMWIHRSCAQEFAAILDGVWDYSDVVMENQL